MATPISRRALLRAAGTSSLAVLLAACNGNTDGAPGTEDGAADEPTTVGDDAGGAPSKEEIDGQILDAVGIDAAATLTPIIVTFEVLTGSTGRIPFGLLDEEQKPLLDRDVQLWVVREGEVVTGPVEPLFYNEGLGERGIYVAEVELSEPGLYDAAVQVDGGPAGVTAFSARTPEQSTTHPPGSEFPALETPTVDDPGALETLCTREPPCSMHEVSLDAALGTGPVVFTVATPQFCTSAVCGPVVDVVEEVKGQLGRDDVTFIHAEVFTDAGNTYSPVVDQLELPSEPWTWVIGADGEVVDRFDGPVVPSLLQDAIERA